MKNWKCDDFSEESHSDCANCAKLRKAMSNAQEFYSAILEALYSEKALPEDFEDWIEETANYLNVKLPENFKTTTIAGVTHYGH